MINITRYILNNRARSIQKIATNYLFYSTFKSISNKHENENDKIDNISQNNIDTNYKLAESYFNHYLETNDNLEETYEHLRKNAIQNHKKSQYLLGILLTLQNISNQNFTVSKKIIESANSAIEVKNDIMKVKKLNTMIKNQSNKPGINVITTRNNSQKSACKYIITVDEILSNKVNNVTANEIMQVTGSLLLSATTLEKENIGIYWLMIASENRYYPAMCYLGNILLNNLDTISDSESSNKVNDANIYLKKAIEWYNNALQSNSEQNIVSEAAFNLGVLYYNGVAIPATTTTKSSSSMISSPLLTYNSSDHDQLCGSSHCSEYHLLPVDRNLSFEYFKQAANLGEPTSQLWCGYCYATGAAAKEGSGVDGDTMPLFINPLLALKYLNLASLSGKETKAKAHFYLAQIYRSGLISNDNLDNNNTTTENKINADSTLYTFHLHEAFILRDVDASFCLADMHFNKFRNTDNIDSIINTIEDEYLAKDLLVSKSPSHLLRAIELYEKASNAGHADASLCLGAISYHNIIGNDPTVSVSLNNNNTNNTNNNCLYRKTQLDAKRRAFEFYNLAAEQGSKEAWRNIASMYYLGIVEKLQ